MAKVARARVARRVPRSHSIKGRGLSPEAKNQFLAKQIAELTFKETTEIKPLKVNKDGVVSNIDYNNPNHMRWLED